MKMILLRQKTYKKPISLGGVRHGLPLLKYGMVLFVVILVLLAWLRQLRNIIVPMKACWSMSQKTVQLILSIVDGQGALGVLLRVLLAPMVSSVIWCSKLLQNEMKLLWLPSETMVASKLRYGMVRHRHGRIPSSSIPSMMQMEIEMHSPSTEDLISNMKILRAT
jgi:hypothetical protein